MSGGPTSAPEDRATAAARAAGWSDADLTWESLSEEALRLRGLGREDRACRLWRQALALARSAFAATDLRLATSLANAAGCAARRGTAADRAALLKEARRIWAGRDACVEALAIERRAGSSLFHLRLERRHRAAYNANARARLHALAAEAGERLRALVETRAAAPHGIERWNAEKPTRYGEVRKLLGACLLLAGPPAGAGWDQARSGALPAVRPDAK